MNAIPEAAGPLRRGGARLVASVFVAVLLIGMALAWNAPPAAGGRDGARADPQDPPAGAAAGQGSGRASAGPRGTPRDAALGYLQASREGRFEEAARYLDLSEVSAQQGSTEAAQLARELGIVLGRKLWIDPALLSDDPEGERSDGLDPDLERLGAVPTSQGDVPILLARGLAEEDGSGALEWRFAPHTVAAIPSMYEEHGYGWIEEVLPRPFFEVTVLDVELWQWIGLVLAVLLASVMGFAAAYGAMLVLRALTLRTQTKWDNELIHSAAAPLRFGLSILAFWLLSHFLALGVAAQGFLDSICEALAVVAVTWLVTRTIDVLAGFLHLRLASRNAPAADTLVPMGRRITKVFVVALAGISVIHNLGFNAAGLLTGLGIGGLAFALAAQKTIENLFGGISVIADRPIEVGQFCRVGDHVGTVEMIGLRSTRMRTLDRTVVTIPNSEFSTARIENFAKRDRILLQTVLQVGYDTTPDQLRWLLVELRRTLYAHPRTLEEPCRVRFVEFGAHSLDIELFVYIDTRDWNEFLAIREDLFLRVMDVVQASGAYFAYPSQTLYLGRDAGRDLERSAQAEEAVRRWREQGELPFPDFPAEARAKPRGTLDFPDKG